MDQNYQIALEPNLGIKGNYKVKSSLFTDDMICVENPEDSTPKLSRKKKLFN
jgi:hypothetical protein